MFRSFHTNQKLVYHICLYNSVLTFSVKSFCYHFFIENNIETTQSDKAKPAPHMNTKVSHYKIAIFRGCYQALTIIRPL
jgi:hypothetical protein